MILDVIFFVPSMVLNFFSLIFEGEEITVGMNHVLETLLVRFTSIKDPPAFLSKPLSNLLKI